MRGDRGGAPGPFRGWALRRACYRPKPFPPRRRARQRTPSRGPDTCPIELRRLAGKGPQLLEVRRIVDPDQLVEARRASFDLGAARDRFAQPRASGAKPFWAFWMLNWAAVQVEPTIVDDPDAGLVPPCRQRAQRGSLGGGGGFRETLRPCARSCRPSPYSCEDSAPATSRDCVVSPIHPLVESPGPVFSARHQGRAITPSKSSDEP